MHLYPKQISTEKMIGALYRHIILSLILVCLMAACNSQEPQEQSDLSSMTFSVELRSRADVTGSDNITAYPFAVYSDMISMDRTTDSSFITVHDATEVSYNTSDRQWSYNDTRYWFPGFQYSFVAFHPAGTQWLSDIIYSNNRLKFTYTQPSDYEAASDLLISAHRRDYAGGSAETVRFNFTHILTNVNMLVAYKCFTSGPSSITIDNLILRNIPIESTYSIKPSPLTGDSKMTSDWVNDEGSLKGWTVNNRGSLKIEFPAGAPRIIQANKGASRLFSNSDALLLLPNPDDPDFPVKLELNYTTNTGQKETVSTIIPRGWNPRTNLTLSLEIANGLVQFSVSVEDWEDGYTTNTTVPRK